MHKRLASSQILLYLDTIKSFATKEEIRMNMLESQIKLLGLKDGGNGL